VFHVLFQRVSRVIPALLQAQPDRQAPRQCIAIGNKWTTGIASLVKVYLGNPVVVIGNHVEAAMFCNVQQIINYVSSSKRESELIGMFFVGRSAFATSEIVGDCYQTINVTGHICNLTLL
jgi:hypothetical protein